MVTALVWSDALAGYRFRAGHPLDPRRLELTMALIRAMDLAGGPDRPIIAPRDATDDELLTVHAPDYVAAVRDASAAASSSSATRARARAGFGLGTEDVPIVPRMHEMSRHAVGATLTAAELVATGRATRAWNIAGGLHHAHAAAASGFCVYNDLAVAIRWLQRAHGMRVLYIDYDAHHGDGVQSIFYDDPGVLTVSLHESGLYLFPGTGFIEELGVGDGHGFAANVPLEARTGDDSFLAAFDAVVPGLADAFRPDIIVLQTGCDAHAADPLTHLRCTTSLFERLVQRVVRIAEKHCGGRIVATGGGGYAIHTVVPRAWTLTWAALCGERAPDAIPDAWLDMVRAEAGVDPPRTLRDPPGAVVPDPDRDEIERANDLTARALNQRILPLLTGWGLAF